jgi:hypothetical protein
MKIMDNLLEAANDFFDSQCLPEILNQESNKYIQSYIYHWSEGSNITYAKVDIPAMGLYINSITIRTNPRDTESLWVQMPKFKAGRQWIAPLQFETSSPLKKLIITYALKAYYEEYGLSSSQTLDEFITDNFP